MDLVRLACVKRAASVHPEPGSNSPTKMCLTRSPTVVVDRDRAIVRRAQLVVLRRLLDAEASRERLSSPLRPCCLAHRVDTTPKRRDRDDRPVSVFGATRDGDTEIDWADTFATRK